MWTKVVSRDRQLRSGRVLRIWAAAVARLVGSVAEKLYDSKLAMRFAYDGRLLGADSWCVWRTLNAWLDIDGHELSRPMGAASVCQLHDPLV